MTQCVNAGYREAMGEAACNFKNACVKAGVHIRQRNKHSSEAIIAHDYRSRTSRIGGTARYSIRAGALDSVNVSKWPTDRRRAVVRSTRVKGIAGMQPVQINRSRQLAASASLVAD